MYVFLYIDMNSSTIESVSHHHFRGLCLSIFISKLGIKALACLTNHVIVGIKSLIRDRTVDSFQGVHEI